MKVQNVLSLKDYVLSVVGSETLPGWPVEALKCQAVLTQTRLARYKPSDCLGDSTQQEAYLGSEHERPAVREAVNAVWGQILTFDHRPITPFYHSTCAGGTSNGSEYFGKPDGTFPYLQAVPCHFCAGSPFSKNKESRIPTARYKSAISGGVPSIISRDAANRPLVVRYSDGRIEGGNDFWLRLGRKLGWDKVPGTRYAVEDGGDGFVRITSSGAGHGVGLCQWGAAGLARQGKSYREILEYYFQGARLRGRNSAP